MKSESHVSQEKVGTIEKDEKDEKDESHETVNLKKPDQKLQQ